jgi:hypothetical protein
MYAVQDGINKVFLHGTYNVHMRTPRKHLRKKVAVKIQQLLLRIFLRLPSMIAAFAMDYVNG